jgi:hypothetical protein
VGPVEQLTPQRLAVRRRHGPEHDRPLARAGLLARADPDGHEPEDAQERVGRDVDGTDAVALQRPLLADQDPGAQLDPLRGHPVARAAPADVVDDAAAGHEQSCCGEQPEQGRADRRVAGDADARRHSGRDRNADHEERGDRDRAAVQPAPAGPVGHVASPGVAWVVAVRRSAKSAATSWSSPSIFSAPFAEAVVTVTVASPKRCSSGPRWVSTVWIRDIGATRHSCQK